jgi:hypothetical protein
MNNCFLYKLFAGSSLDSWMMVYHILKSFHQSGRNDSFVDRILWRMWEKGRLHGSHRL